MLPNHRLALALAISSTVHAALLVALAPTYITQFSTPPSPIAVLEVRLGPMENGIESTEEPPAEAAQDVPAPTDVPHPTSEGPIPLLPLPPAKQYIPSRELDSRPQAVDPIIVPFPESASLGRPKGTVTLALYISATGIVERVEAEKSELPQAFVEAATNSFLYARMQPGIKNGQPVASKMRIEVEFAEGH